MQDQCRHSDRGQKVADVDLQRHPQYGTGCGRAGAEAQELRPPSLETLVIGVAWGPHFDVDWPAPVALHCVEAAVVLLQCGRPWVVDCSHTPGVRPIKS